MAKPSYDGCVGVFKTHVDMDDVYMCTARFSFVSWLVMFMKGMSLARCIYIHYVTPPPLPSTSCMYVR